MTLKNLSQLPGCRRSSADAGPYSGESRAASGEVVAAPRNSSQLQRFWISVWRICLSSRDAGIAPQMPDQTLEILEQHP